MAINKFEDLGVFLFSSVNNDGKLGSLYFQNGRVRLIHQDGPHIDEYKAVSYFIVDINTDVDVILNNLADAFPMQPATITDIVDITNIISESTSYCKYVCDNVPDSQTIQGCLENLDIREPYAIFEVLYDDKGIIDAVHLSRGMFSFDRPIINMKELFGKVLTRFHVINTIGNHSSNYIKKMNNQLYLWINNNSKLNVYSPEEL